jgi:hypothetical protein
MMSRTVTVATVGGLLLLAGCSSAPSSAPPTSTGASTTITRAPSVTLTTSTALTLSDAAAAYTAAYNAETESNASQKTAGEQTLTSQQWAAVAANLDAFTNDLKAIKWPASVASLVTADEAANSNLASATRAVSTAGADQVLTALHSLSTVGATWSAADNQLRAALGLQPGPSS